MIRIAIAIAIAITSSPAAASINRDLDTPDCGTWIEYERVVGRMTHQELVGPWVMTWWGGPIGRVVVTHQARDGRECKVEEFDVRKGTR